MNITLLIEDKGCWQAERKVVAGAGWWDDRSYYLLLVAGEAKAEVPS